MPRQHRSTPGRRGRACCRPSARSRGWVSSYAQYHRLLANEGAEIVDRELRVSLRLLRRRVIISATTATTATTAVTGVVLGLVVGDPHHNGPLHPLRVVDDAERRQEMPNPRLERGRNPVVAGVLIRAGLGQTQEAAVAAARLSRARGPCGEAFVAVLDLDLVRGFRVPREPVGVPALTAAVVDDDVLRRVRPDPPGHRRGVRALYVRGRAAHG